MYEALESIVAEAPHESCALPRLTLHPLTRYPSLACPFASVCERRGASCPSDESALRCDLTADKVFQNTGLERVAALEKDIAFFKDTYVRHAEPLAICMTLAHVDSRQWVRFTTRTHIADGPSGDRFVCVCVCVCVCLRRA